MPTKPKVCTKPWGILYRDSDYKWKPEKKSRFATKKAALDKAGRLEQFTGYDCRVVRVCGKKK